MALTIRAIGQARKRGIIPRLPTGERLAGDIETWLEAEYRDVVRSTDRASGPDGPARLRVGLHPAAPDLSLEADDTGRVVVTAATTPVGPGYHTFVGRILERIGAEHAIDWTTGEAAVAAGGSDRAPGSAPRPWVPDDRAAAERAHLAWLRATLTAAQDIRRRGGSGVHLGTPGGVRYTFDGAIATPLGPRDDAWLERALVDPRVAIDILPWWTDATDARYLLDRALCLLWTEIRWRSPGSGPERAAIDEALALLRHAYPLDPSLPYPWREWRELLELRGASDPARPAIEARAAEADRVGGPRIGYRRAPVTVVYGRWALEVPGTFSDRRTERSWVGGDAGRLITLTPVDVDPRDARQPASILLRRAGAPPGTNVLRHAAGDVEGIARLEAEDRSGIAVGVLEGLTAVTGAAAGIRIEFDDAAEWQWAMDRWKAVRPA